MVTRSKPRRHGPGEPLERVAVDRQGQVGDALVGAHARSLRTAASALASRPRCSQALGLLRAGRGGRPAAAPLAALVLGRLPGAGWASPSRSGCCWSRGWCGWRRRCDVVPYGTAADRRRARRCWRWPACWRRCGCARSARGCEAGGAAAGAGAAGAALRAAADDPVRRRLFWSAPRPCSPSRSPRWRAARSLRARRVEHREADGHGVHQRHQRVDSLPAARPVDGGETLNYYYLGHLAAGAGRSAARRSAPTRATTSRWRLLLGAHGDRGVHARRARCGRPRARRGARAPRGGPVAAGLVAVGAVPRARQPRRRARVAATPPTRRATTTGSTPSRVIPDTINEFPSFSFLLGDLHAHVLALPFTVLALGVRAAGRARRPARRRWCWRAVAEALAAGLADRRAVRDQLVVVSGRGGPAGRARSSIWLRGPAARAARRTRVVWLGLVLVASVVLMLPFWLELRPGGARDRLRRTSARSFARVARRHGADLRHPRVAAARPRSPARLLGSRAAAGASLGWGARGGDRSCGSLLAAADLPGAAVARRRARRSASAPRSSRAARRARALPVAADRRRRWRCC